VFEISEVKRGDTAPAMGNAGARCGSFRMRFAMELLLLWTSIDRQEALSFGSSTGWVPAAELMTASEQVASSFARTVACACGRSKELAFAASTFPSE